jgi:hypothetical protein
MHIRLKLSTQVKRSIFPEIEGSDRNDKYLDGRFSFYKQPTGYVDMGKETE